MADAEELAETSVVTTPVAEMVGTTAQDLAELVGLDRGLAIGATGRYETAEGLRDALAPVFDHSLDLVGIADDRGRTAYLNRAAQTRFGQSADTGYSTERLYPPAALDLYYREIRPAVLARGSWRGVVPMRCASGEIIHVRQSITGGVGKGGDTIEWLLTIAEDAREAPPIWPDRPAHRDVLTGLANRTWFDARLADALASVHDDGCAVGVVHCDLPTVSKVHDAQGPAIANVVLIELGRRLVALSGPTDVIARDDDHELVVLSETPAGARSIARLAWHVRNGLCAEPVVVGEQAFVIEAMVGVATSSTRGRGVDELIDAARTRARAARA